MDSEDSVYFTTPQLSICNRFMGPPEISTARRIVADVNYDNQAAQ